MIFDKEKIANKIPHFGKVTFDVEPTWDDAIKFLDTHPEHLIDTHTTKMRVFLKNAHKRGSLERWAKDIVKQMSEIFYENEISLITFLGVGKNTDSYPWHKDKMDVFLVQVLGDVLLKVENSFAEEKSIIFSPGDCVYIPRGTHHHVIPQRSRVTFSFGVEREPDPATYVKV